MKRTTIRVTAIALLAIGLFTATSCKKKPVACMSFETTNAWDTVYVGRVVHFSSCSENEQRLEWNMGNGSKFTYPQVDFAFTTPGIHQVSLTVWNDNDNNSDMVTQDIKVFP